MRAGEFVVVDLRSLSNGCLLLPQEEEERRWSVEYRIVSVLYPYTVQLFLRGVTWVLRFEYRRWDEISLELNRQRDTERNRSEIPFNSQTAKTGNEGVALVGLSAPKTGGPACLQPKKSTHTQLGESDWQGEYQRRPVRSAGYKLIFMGFLQPAVTTGLKVHVFQGA